MIRFTRRAGMMDPSRVFNRGIERRGGTFHITGTAAREPSTGRRPAGPDDGYAQVFWTAFRRSANAMFVVGLDRRIVAVNEAGTALAGRSADALTGERMTTLLDDPAEAPDDAVGAHRCCGANRSAAGGSGGRTARRASSTSRCGPAAPGDRARSRRVRPQPRRPPLGAGARAGPADHAREEIVGRIALGEVTPEICAALHIAPDTVRTHVRNAMAKTVRGRGRS